MKWKEEEKGEEEGEEWGEGGGRMIEGVGTVKEQGKIRSGAITNRRNG